MPLAKWVVSKTTGWQVWSVERRENLLEDQSELNAFKQGKTTSTQLYDYYLGYLKDPSVANHFQMIPSSTVAFAKQWGMNVAVEDLHRVIGAAKQRGGKVVLGGHSLGGSVVTAYATWNFNGRAGADDLAGLVYIDGGSGPSTMTAAQANQQLQALNAPSVSPWLSFGGIAAPFAGLYNATGSLAALRDPNAPSLGQTSGLLPSNIVPPVRVTNVGQYGYALNVATSPASLAAAQAHLGTGITAAGPVHGWNGVGALTPITRFATMFSGAGINNVDGTEWYFPQRLTNDTAVVNNGNASPAQDALDVHATMGHELPKRLKIYAFGAHLGGARRRASRADAGGAVEDSRRESHAREPPEHVRAQRPRGRVSAQRLLCSPRAVPQAHQVEIRRWTTATCSPRWSGNLESTFDPPDHRDPTVPRFHSPSTYRRSASSETCPESLAASSARWARSCLSSRFRLPSSRTTTTSGTKTHTSSSTRPQIPASTSIASPFPCPKCTAMRRPGQRVPVAACAVVSGPRRVVGGCPRAARPLPPCRRRRGERVEHHEPLGEPLR